MQKKVLILGSSGLIGHQVYRVCQETGRFKMFNAAGTRRLNNETTLIDIRNIEDTIVFIKEVNPDVIVNCAGVLISTSNSDPETSILVNAYFPHRLKKLCDEIGSKLIHISTDCVFSGRDGGYDEDSLKDGYDTYSKTKGLGEITTPPHLTLRTSVVGPELKANGEELFHWFMSQEGAINGFTKALWSGVTTIELAKAVVWAIDSDITGVYHVTNSQPISKYDLLQLFKKYSGKEIIINKTNGRNVNKSFIDTRNLLDNLVPSYIDMIKEMFDYIRANIDNYPHYLL